MTFKSKKPAEADPEAIEGKKQPEKAKKTKKKRKKTRTPEEYFSKLRKDNGVY